MSECEITGNSLCAGPINDHNGIFGLEAIHHRVPWLQHVGGNAEVNQGVIYSSVTVPVWVRNGLCAWSFIYIAPQRTVCENILLCMCAFVPHSRLTW